MAEEDLPRVRATSSHTESSDLLVKGIVTGTLETVRSVLNSTDEKGTLVNSEISWDYTFQDIHVEPCLPLLKINKPLALAVVFGATSTISLLLENGANLFSTDDLGNNIIHCLINVSWHDQKCESQAEQTYVWLRENLPRTSLKRLLLAENNGGLRPLELAANLGILSLFLQIFRTEGVYVTSKRVGIHRVEYFDIHEYCMSVSANCRARKSPLILMSSLCETQMGKICKYFQPGNPIREWAEVKIHQRLFYVAVLLLSRLVYLVWFVLLDLHAQHLLSDFVTPSSNVTYGTCHIQFVTIQLPYNLLWSLITALLLSTVTGLSMTVLHAGVDVVRYFRKRFSQDTPGSHCGGNLEVLMYAGFVDAICMLSVFIYTLTLALSHGHLTTHSISILRHTCPIAYTAHFIGLLRFTLFLPKVGYFAIVVLKMMVDISIFFGIFGSFIFFMQIAFSGIVDECPADEILYQYGLWCKLTKLLLVSVDMDSYKSHSPFAFDTWQLLFAVIGSLLLLNFLIALFADTFRKVKDSTVAEAVLYTQRLLLIYQTEQGPLQFIESNLARIFSKDKRAEYLTIFEIDVTKRDC